MKSSISILVALLLAAPALADPLVIGPPAGQPKITNEKDFSKAYANAAETEHTVMMQLVSGKADHQDWLAIVPLGNPGQLIGTLTIVDRDGNCATVKNEVKRPSLGNWTYKACKLPSGQFSID